MSKKFDLFFLIASLVLIGSLTSWKGVAEAAADITIDSATIISPHTVQVVLDDLGGDSVNSIDAAKWHIDRNTDGDSPLSPTGSSIVDDNIINLTFSGTPFSDAAKAYDASHGLYVEADGVTDDNDDTNEVLSDDESIAIDGQAPEVSGGGDEGEKGGVSCPPGHLFKVETGERCSSSTGQVFCPPGQMFNGKTGERCNAVSNPNAPGASGYTFGSGLVKQGSRGQGCRAWQNFFNDKVGAHLVADGVCGPLTMGVAKGWQAAHGLTADGVLGPMSRGKANIQ